jgi:hypothetical protein
MPDKVPAWYATITPDDVPQRFRGLVELVGLDGAIKVLHHLAGAEYYFPKMEGAAGFMEARNRYLRERYRKHNARQLAQEAGLTINELRLIVRDHEDQADLFPAPPAPAGASK